MAWPSVMRNQWTCIGPGKPVGSSTNGSDGVTNTIIAFKAGG